MLLKSWLPLISHGNGPQGHHLKVLTPDSRLPLILRGRKYANKSQNSEKHRFDRTIYKTQQKTFVLNVRCYLGHTKIQQINYGLSCGIWKKQIFFCDKATISEPWVRAFWCILLPGVRLKPQKLGRGRIPVCTKGLGTEGLFWEGWGMNFQVGIMGKMQWRATPTNPLLIAHIVSSGPCTTQVPQNRQSCGEGTDQPIHMTLHHAVTLTDTHV